jgi:LppP/LprE lipoprotein
MGAILMTLGPPLGGCGWEPAAPPPLAHETCTEADGPSVAAVRRAIAGLEPIDGRAWVERSRGSSGNCALSWVEVAAEKATASTPAQVLFFDRDTFLGTPTPDPKPYITVVASGQDNVTVQYEWLQGDEPDCCPTGTGSVRFRLDRDGRLTALGPIPNQG